MMQNFWSILFLFCFFISVSSLTVQVNELSDSSNPSSTSCATPDEPCNLRDAWTYCLNQNTSISSCCEIYLPVNETILIQYDTLVLNAGTACIAMYGIQTTILYAGDFSGSSGGFVSITATQGVDPPVLVMYDLTIKSFGSYGQTVGAGIYSSGSVYMFLDHVIFDSNQGFYGAAIAMTNNHLLSSFTNVEVKNSYSEVAGAMVFIDSYSMTISNSTFQSNIAESTYYTYGGAIYIESCANIILRDNSFLSNSAVFGGSIMMSATDQVEITSNNFSSSIATVGGGIMLNEDVSNVVMSESQFIDCRADSYGGGFSVYSSASYIIMTDILFENCHSDFYSGGLDLFGSVFESTFERITFTGCTSNNNGGAMRIGAYSTNLLFRHVEVNNCASGQGGCFYIYESNTNITVEDSSLKNCLVRGGGFGGAVRIYQFNTNVIFNRVSIDHATIETTGNGGCFQLEKGNTYFQLIDSILSFCSAQSGGAISLLSENNNVLIRNSIIQNATARFNGGAIALFNDNNEFTLLNSTIIGCSAGNIGGALYSSSSNQQLSVAGCDISHNTATTYGGALYLESQEEILISSVESYETKERISTSHPYTSGYPVNGERYVILSATVNVSEASGFAFFFSEETFIYFTDTLYIYSSPSKDTLLFQYSSGSQYPGVSAPIQIVENLQTLYIEFDGPTSSGSTLPTTYYGFDLIVVPIIPNVTQPTRIAHNYCGLDGGGVILYDGTPNAIIMNVTLDSNQAMNNAGGLFLRTGSLGTVLFSVSFLHNQAATYGGGMMVGWTQLGLRLVECEFELNKAGFGGGLYLYFQNGIGTWQPPSNNLIHISDSLFINNSASNDGGGLYISTANAVDITSCRFIKNSASINGGGIYSIGSQGQVVNDLSLSSTILMDNFATLSGGGMYATINNQLQLSNVTVHDNAVDTRVGIGGGLYILQSDPRIEISETVILRGNRAYIGGGMACVACALWDIVDGAGNSGTNSGSAGQYNVVFSDNEAFIGSALYVDAWVSDSTSAEAFQLTSTAIMNNTARDGGTIYWIYAATTMTSFPAGLYNATEYSSIQDLPSDEYYYEDTNVFWSHNEANYGPYLSTQAIEAESPSFWNITVYDAAISPPIVLNLVDAYGQAIVSNSTARIMVEIAQQNESQCLGNNPYLAGQNTVAAGVDLLNGLGIFDQLSVYCAPLGNLTLGFTAYLTQFTNSLSNPPVYFLESSETIGQLENQTFASFRACQVGEYLTAGMCLVCPDGSFSVTSPSSELPVTSCTVCNTIEGVASCGGDEIELSSGYWRRYATTSAVMACPYPSNCVGGNLTGDYVCLEGSYGPLCGVCSSGYFNNGETCVACSDGSSALTPTTIGFIVVVAVLLAIVGVIMVNTSDTKETKVGEDSNKQVQTIEQVRVAMPSMKIHVVNIVQNVEYGDSDDEYEVDSNGQVVREGVALQSGDNSHGVEGVEHSNSQHHNDKQEAEESSWRLWYEWLKSSCSQWMVKIKIIVTTFQVVFSTSSVLSVSLPKAFTSFASSLSVINIPISSLVPVSCAASYNFIDTLVMTTLFPIILTALLFVAFRINYRVTSARRIYHHRLHHQPASIKQSVKEGNDKDTVVNGEPSHHIDEEAGTSSTVPSHPASAAASSMPTVSPLFIDDNQSIQRIRRQVYQELKDTYLNYFLYLTFLILPSVTTTIFQMYPCTNIDPDNESPDEENWYLTADLSISCSSDEYYGGVTYASIMILVYPVGIPLLYLWMLWRCKEEIMARCDPPPNSTTGHQNDSAKDGTMDPGNGAIELEKWRSTSTASTRSNLSTDKTRNDSRQQRIESATVDATMEYKTLMSAEASRLAFLWQSYQPKYWYWELVDTLRKILLTAVLSVCDPGSSQQSVFAVLLALVFIKVYGYYNPFFDSDDNLLSEVGQYQIFFTFFISLIITNDLLDGPYKTMLDAALIIINLSVVLLTARIEIIAALEEKASMEAEVTKALDEEAKTGKPLKSLRLRGVQNKKAKMTQSENKALQRYYKMVRKNAAMKRKMHRNVVSGESPLDSYTTAHIVVTNPLISNNDGTSHLQRQSEVSSLFTATSHDYNVQRASSISIRSRAPSINVVPSLQQLELRRDVFRDSDDEH